MRNLVDEVFPLDGNLNRSGKEIVKTKPFKEDDDNNCFFDSFLNHQDGVFPLDGNLNRSGKEIVKTKPFKEDDDNNCFLTVS